MKAYIIIAHTGQEIIDVTPNAPGRINAMKYNERRYRREQKRMKERANRLARNPLLRLAAFCGIV